jgi:uncharacterized protein YdcH (DUF465 family)
MADAQVPLNGDVKAELLQTDEGFRQLVSEHQALDERIRLLSSFSHLTDQQRYEEMALKKHKLVLKDRIEGMIRSPHAAQPASRPQH